MFLRLQPYKKLSLKQQGKNRLAPKFYGPFQINKKIIQVAYRLELPENFRIHNVFHISCLKKMLGQAQRVQTEIPEFDEEGKNYFRARKYSCHKGKDVTFQDHKGISYQMEKPSRRGLIMGVQTIPPTISIATLALRTKQNLKRVAMLRT